MMTVQIRATSVARGPEIQVPFHAYYKTIKHEEWCEEVLVLSTAQGAIEIAQLHPEFLLSLGVRLTELALEKMRNK